LLTPPQKKKPGVFKPIFTALLLPEDIMVNTCEADT